MEQRNWQVWLAIALGGLALIVALSGRSAPIVQNYEFVRPEVGSYAQPAQPPQPPQPPQPGAWQRSDPAGSDSFREFGGSNHGAYSYREYSGSVDTGEGRFSGMHGREGFRGGPPHRHGFFGPFVLISILFKLVGIGALIFLLVRLFNKQKASAAPPAGN